MLTTIRSIAVVDRTGTLQYALRSSDVAVVDVHPTELDAIAGDADVLFVGARELTATGLRRIARWRRLQPAGYVVAHDEREGTDRRMLRAHGIDHIVRGRATTAKVRTALLHGDVAIAELIEAAGRHLGGVELIAPAEVVNEWEATDDEQAWEEELTDAADPDEHVDGTQLARLVTIASATGGCGKTFFATNAAAMLARRGARVLLVDLDLQFGEVAAALQVQHAYSLYDGLYGTSGERLPVSAMREHMDALVHHHELGFDVLTAPRDPILADFVGARDAMTLLDAVMPRYDVVIADTPPSLNDVVIAALDRSDVVWVLASLDVPSLRNLTAFLDVLKRLGMHDDRVRLLLNKADKDVGVTAEQANEAFGGRFQAVFPVDRAVSRSVNLGTTVVTHEPRARISRSLTPAISALAGELGLAAESAAPAIENAHRKPFGAYVRRLLLGGSA